MPGATRFLVFTLAAPLASFGAIAPGERRVTASRPGRSGLVGLIAAALGLARDDPRQNALAASLAFAVRIDRAGSLMSDYHTTQTAPARKGRAFTTRYQELQVADLGTILSLRDYRSDSAFTVAVIADTGGPFPLPDIATALERPAFVLTAGRRACPLGLPPAPLLVDAPSLPDAFDRYDATQSAADSDTDRARRMLRHDMGLRMPGDSGDYDIACDSRFIERELIAATVSRDEVRRDEPVDRVRWQFATRTEHVVRLRPAVERAS
jgi:CRISPR system Cascade subunit CasD